MADLENYRLQRTAGPQPVVPPEPRLPLVWVIAPIVLLLAVGGYLLFGRKKPVVVSAPAQPAALAKAVEVPHAPLGGTAESVEVPPLASSDPVVRLLVQSMSTHPRVVAWLATDNLIRNFTVVVGNIADGRTPARHLGVLRPDGRFRTSHDAGGLRIDPASYQRYNQIAAAVGSIDPQAAARVYATLKPRIEEAQRDLGSPKSFDGTLETAIVRLVQTPLEGDTRVLAKGAEGFQYVDERLESLTDAQKLLLRMGPGNARIVQDKLKAIGLALGIPAARLGG